MISRFQARPPRRQRVEHRSSSAAPGEGHLTLVAGRTPPLTFAASVALAALCAMCVLIAFPARDEARRPPTVKELTARIEREGNPVKKAKLQVRLAHLEIVQAVSAYDHRRIQDGQKLLSTAAAEVQDTWRLLRSTGRNAARKPDGFMQLEIGTREDARLLNELRQRTFYLYRGPIDAALKTLTHLHAQVLLALFPGAAPPGKQGHAPKSSSHPHPRGSTHP
ncbi:MAG: hypothetical protein ACRD3D_04010 [Terriglobia bacterium]